MDKERDIYFANRGIKTIRIKNETVINNNLSILIDRMIKSREREAKNWLTKEF
jgi:very-short-patch-repair endonuclease